MKRDFVAKSDLLGTNVKCITFTGKEELLVPLALVHIESPYFTGVTKVCVVDHPVADIIIGNCPEVNATQNINIPIACPVVTRQQSQNQESTVKSINPKPIVTDSDLFIKEQEEDLTLKSYFDKAKSGEIADFKKGTVKFIVENGFLYRVLTKSNKIFKQLMVPSCRRQSILSIAHDSPMAGHMVINRTKTRILDMEITRDNYF